MLCDCIDTRPTALSVNQKPVVSLPSHRTLQVTITNFSLSKLLVSDDELLRDQRGSLAYISPDVLSGEPGMHLCEEVLQFSVRRGGGYIGIV